MTVVIVHAFSADCGWAGCVVVRQVLYDVFLPSVAKSSQPQGRGRDRDNALCNDLFNSHPLSVAYMVPCLIGLYGDVEHTGFYEKLEHRWVAAVVLDAAGRMCVSTRVD